MISPVEVMAPPASAAASHGFARPRATTPLHSLWTGSTCSRPVVVAREPEVAPEPVVALEPVVAPEPVDAVHAPTAVEVSDSVPLLAVVLPSSIATDKVPRVIVTLPPRPMSAMPRRRIALALGAAAALVLAVGIAAAPTASPRIEHAAVHEGHALATHRVDPAVETLPPSSPSPAMPVLAAPVRSDEQRLALAVMRPTEAVAPVLEPTPPQPRRTRRAPRRGRVPTVAAVETSPEPTPAPRRSSSSRRARPVSADELLFDGEVALRLGNAKQAYQLAKRGRHTGAHEDAASLVARSACRIGERNEAKQALRDLPLLERGAVRRDCRRSGSPIGL